MSKFKKPLLFSLAVLPIIVIAVILSCLYQFSLYPDEYFEEAVNQLGSMKNIFVISAVQGSILILICCFFGYILSDKVNLWTPLHIEKSKLLRTLPVSIAAGLIFSLDYWTFGAYEPLIQNSAETGLSFISVTAAVLYGGIAEELLMRLFLMSLIAFVIWKLFFKHYDKHVLPTGIFIAANIISALIFAAGHLPATAACFGVLTPILLIRCFLLNGGFGLIFGNIYRKYGIWYAMISHILLHIVSKTIWIIFI